MDGMIASCARRPQKRQWSSHKVDTYGCTSRGPLHLMVVHTVVQWLASLCRGCRRIAIARSTSHSVCHSTCCEWLCLRLFKASETQSGRYQASKADSPSNLVGAVAPPCSAVRFTRILRSRQKVSLFSPSAAATRPKANKP